MATDYDSGKVTDREKLAAKRQKELAKYNANSIWNELNYRIGTYDVADEQNKNLRDLQLKEAARKGEADRFETQRQLQNAALGLFASASPAMNGSTTGNMMSMLRNRNDADNSTYWEQRQENANAINNAYNESFAQNRIARRDAAATAAKALRDTNSDLSANLSNINPNLYEPPGKKTSTSTSGTSSIGSAIADTVDSKSDVQKVLDKVVDKLKGYTAYKPPLSGYIMPANAEQNVIGKRNKLQGNDYFSQLINSYNY